MKRYFAALLFALIFASTAAATPIETIILSSSPTVDTTPAYTTGDAVTGLITFSNACDPRTNLGEIRGVTIIDQSANGQDLDLVLFSSNPSATTFTRNSALDIADADLLKVTAVIPVTTHKAFADNGISQAKNIAYSFACSSASTLYGVLVARNAGTLQYTAGTDVTVRIEFLAD